MSVSSDSHPAGFVEKLCYASCVACPRVFVITVPCCTGSVFADVLKRPRLLTSAVVKLD